MERSRQCDSPEPVGGGKPCVGLLTQQKDCNLRDCPGLYDLVSRVSQNTTCTKNVMVLHCVISVVKHRHIT